LCAFSVTFLPITVHPATWFKVVFPPEPKIVTFRPSALQAVDEDGKPLSTYVVKSTFARTSANGGSSIASRSSDSAAAKIALPPRNRTSFNDLSLVGVSKPVGSQPAKRSKPLSGVVNGSSLTFSSLDPETWIGRKVLIVVGRHNGQVGVVRGVASGWLQLDTPVGDIAKRAAEIRLLPSTGAPSTGYSDQEDNDMTSLEGEQALQDDSDDGSGVRRKRRASAMAGVSSAVNSLIRRPKRVRKISDGTDYDSGDDDLDERDGFKVSHKETPRDPMSSAFPLDPTLYAYPILNEDREEVKSRREHLNQYLRNVQVSCKRRPNLSDWQQKVNAALTRFTPSSPTLPLSLSLSPLHQLPDRPLDTSFVLAQPQASYLALPPFAMAVAQQSSSLLASSSEPSMIEEDGEEDTAASSASSVSAASTSTSEKSSASASSMNDLAGQPKVRDLQYKAMIAAKRPVYQEKWQERLKHKLLPYGHVTAKEIMN
jgi:hypothetical protein